MTDPQPVDLLIERDHAFKKKAPHPDGRKRTGCATCGRAMLARPHLGAPPRLHDSGPGLDPNAYAALKAAWQWALADALEASGLPRGLEVVVAEVMIGFDQYREKDEGNFRWMVEKALGDALVDGYWYWRGKKPDRERVQVVEGGWLPDDSFWPTRRYSMGNLAGTHDPGRSWTRVALFPSLVPPVPAPRAGETPATQEALPL